MRALSKLSSIIVQLLDVLGIFAFGPFFSREDKKCKTLPLHSVICLYLEMGHVRFSAGPRKNMLPPTPCCIYLILKSLKV